MTGSTAAGGIFAGLNPLTDGILLLLFQITIIVSLSRSLAIVLRYFRQPTVIAEVIGGILLGPSALGQIPGFLQNVFPSSGMTTLNTVAQFGLVFYLCLVGLELDVNMMRQKFLTSFAISVAGMVVPFAISIGPTYLIWQRYLMETASLGVLVLFLGICMAITAFPVLARIMGELRLFNTPVGVQTISAAAVDDAAAWALLAIVVGIINAEGSFNALYIIICLVAFASLVLLLVKPGLRILVNHGVGSDGTVPQWVLVIMFLLIMASAFMTEFLGVHVIFGAFLMGLSIPREHGFAIAVTEKMEDFVSIILLPIYFAFSGLNTNLTLLNDGTAWGIVFLVIATACLGKILGCFTAAFFSGLRPRESLAVGVMMNCKGLVELIALNLGYSAGVINQTVFSIFVLMAVLTTLMTAPLMSVVYPRSYYIHEMSSDDEEMVMELDELDVADGCLELCVCLPGLRFVPGMMNFTKLLVRCKSTKSVHAVRMVQASERSSSIMKATQHQSDDALLGVFQELSRLHDIELDSTVTVAPIDDLANTVCEIATSKGANMLLIPYNDMDSTTDYATSHVIQGKVISRILNLWKRRVGVLVDRGIGFGAKEGMVIMVPFFGGPDDREALKMAVRFAAHDQVEVHVVQVTVKVESMNEAQLDDRDQKLLNAYATRCEQKPRKFHLNIVSGEDASQMVVYWAKQIDPSLCIVGHVGSTWAEMNAAFGVQDTMNEKTVNSVIARRLKTLMRREDPTLSIGSHDASHLTVPTESHQNTVRSLASVTGLGKLFESTHQSSSSSNATKLFSSILGEIGESLYRKLPRTSVLAIRRIQLATQSERESSFGTFNF